MLVVVLIIGILAAFGIVQYQKAVKTARLQEGMINMKNILEAETLYHLVNGDYTADISKLDIQLSSNWSYTITSYKRLDIVDPQRTIWVECNLESRVAKCNSKGSTENCLLLGFLKSRCGPRVYGEWGYHCSAPSIGMSTICANTLSQTE
jgi:type II secretory pathway pseudopilin PulG